VGYGLLAALDSNPFFLDVRVAAEENCFPMVPAGCGHNDIMLSKDRRYV
jgi:acetolactate synthase-1/2/3 large subunit